MQDWVEELNTMLKTNRYEVLENKGKISAEEAKEFAENEFEKFRIEQDKNNPNKQIEIAIPSHRDAWFNFAGKKTKASVNKSITPVEEMQKEKLAISLCRDAKDKQFWLIHRLDKVTVPPPRPIDIDELNNDLDSLINLQDG